jgi:hypothetical protein
MTPRPLVLGVALAALAAGCSDRPKAPPITRDPVFQSDKVGVRFLAPEGWPMVSRADPPAGKLPRPVVVVSYAQGRGEKPAEFEVTAADLAADADPAQFLAEHRIGGERWALKGGPDPVTINGAAAARYTLARGSGKNEVRREATVFRRGDRAYFFVVTYAAADPEHRDHARRSIDSITWKD